MKSRRSSKRIRSTRIRRIMSTSRNRNKWLRSWNGSRISHIRSMMRIRHSWKNIHLSNLSLRFNKEIKICCWRNCWWRRNKMLLLEPKWINMKSYSMKFQKRWRRNKSNQKSIYPDLPKWKSTPSWKLKNLRLPSSIPKG